LEPDVAADDNPQILRAKDSAIFDHDGKRVTLIKGMTIEVGHPMLKGREHLFEPLAVDFPKQSARARVK
jgi:phage gp45-like